MWTDVKKLHQIHTYTGDYMWSGPKHSFRQFNFRTKHTMAMLQVDCPVCETTFANSDYLAQHMRIHTDENPQ